MKKMCKLFSVLMAAALSLTLLATAIPAASAETVSDYAATDYATKSDVFTAIMSKYTGEEVKVKASDGQLVTVKYEGEAFKLTDMNGETPYLRDKTTIEKDTEGNITNLGTKALDDAGAEIQITAETLGINATYSDNTVILPYPEAYVQGTTLRMKYIFDATVIKEKYSDKTFVLKYAGAELTVKGSYFNKLAADAERVEFSLKASVPFKKDNDNNDAEAVRGALSIIRGEKPHPVVGDYVFEMSIYVNNVATYDVGAADKDITVKITANQEQFNAAASGSNKNYNVYAYLDPSATAGDETYDNMGAKIDEANATATFTLKNIGWFFLACDDPSNQEGTIPVVLIIAIAAAAVVVIAAIVVVIVMAKKKKGAAPADTQANE